MAAALVSDAHKRLGELRQAREARAAARHNGTSTYTSAEAPLGIDLAVLVEDLLLEGTRADDDQSREHHTSSMLVHKDRQPPKLGTAKQVEVTISPWQVEIYERGTQTIDSHTSSNAVEPASVSASNLSTLWSMREADDDHPRKAQPLSRATSPADEEPAGTAKPPVGKASALLSASRARAVEETDAFSAFLRRSASLVERTLSDRRPVECWTSDRGDTVDYTAVGSQPAAVHGADPRAVELRPVVTLSDDSTLRAVMDVQWSAHHADLLLGCYVRHGLGGAGGLHQEQLGEGADGRVLIWSLQLPSRPEFTFECESAVLCARFCALGGANVVVGGGHSGQLLLWDTRAQRTPVQRSAIGLDVRGTWGRSTAGGSKATGHAMPVHAIEVVGGAQMMISLSTDGRLCTWDLAALRAPTGTLQLARPPTSGRPAAGPGRAHALDETALEVPTCSLAFPAGDTTRCAVGCEDGSIYHVVRHGVSGGGVARELGAREPAMGGSIGHDALLSHKPAHGSAHAGPVHALDFHPGLRQHSRGLLLSASADWGVKLWSCGGLHSNDQELLLSLEGSQECILDARWAPHRSALLATADAAGCVSLWNLATDTEQPAIHVPVTPKACTRLNWSGDGNTLAIGDSSGSIHVQRVLTDVPTDNEEQALETKLWAAAQRRNPPSD